MGLSLIGMLKKLMRNILNYKIQNVKSQAKVTIFTSQFFINYQHADDFFSAFATICLFVFLT